MLESYEFQARNYRISLSYK